ncbi:MAG: ferrochelatase [Vampirovibrionales bacterium]|nr:ferrochelatase [Vampirovibrionales bacterium]
MPSITLPKKTGLLFLNMGGPDGLDSVQPFLFNLFSDPDIIRLPLSSLLQKPLAWYISSSRKKEACHNYSLMGGASPQLPLTREQVRHVQDMLEMKGYGQLPVYLAMRYWHPFTQEALDQIQADGIEHLIVVSLYPHFSYTTTGSSINELKRQLATRKLNVSLSVVSGYARSRQYLEALATTIQQGLSENPWTCAEGNVHILFSAHSLPLKHIKRTRDPYPEHIYLCIKTLMEAYFPKHDWDLAYQSKVGNMPWLGPYTDSALQFYAAKQINNVLIVPISFVTDHIETLVEIDQQYIPMARTQGLATCFRAPALNSNPKFILALSDMIEDRLKAMVARFNRAIPPMPV